LALLEEGNLANASRFVEAAANKDPDHRGTLLLELTVVLWESGWPAARPKFEAWVRGLAPEFVFPWGNRNRLIAIVAKARECGGLDDLAAILRASPDRSCWDPWLEAIDAVSGRRSSETLSGERASELYRRLTEIKLPAKPRLGDTQVVEI
jgi:hypothetical protein